MIRIGDVPVSDADIVRRIARTVLDNMPPYTPDSEDYEWLLPDGNRIVVGAYDNTSLVGFCTVDSIEQFLDLAHVPDSPPNTCYVSALALEPEMRDRHLGTRMLKSAVLEAKKKAQWDYVSGAFSGRSINERSHHMLPRNQRWHHQIRTRERASWIVGDLPLHARENTVIGHDTHLSPQPQ